jgi:hypothetical protein
MQGVGDNIDAVSGDLSLFGDEEPVEPAKPVPPQVGLPDWLVDAVRDVLNARGLATMSERQQAIEAITKRPVESLRSLTRAEALYVLSELTPNSPSTFGTSWDDRQEDTWIDRL